ATIQSPQTARFRHDVKQGVSAGISGQSIPGFWSLGAFAHFGCGFWRPVSASKNSVPGCRPCPQGPDRICGRNSDFWATMFRDFGPALELFRIESERLKLPAPFGRRIAEPLDADAAGQATFYGRFD